MHAKDTRLSKKLISINTHGASILFENCLNRSAQFSEFRLNARRISEARRARSKVAQFLGSLAYIGAAKSRPLLVIEHTAARLNSTFQTFERAF